jgi:pimeloyl-ACP methyl ester carboxylesterase
MMRDVPFVLVHGGGCDRRCWSRLQPLLNDAVFALDLPGRGSNPADLSTVKVEDFVEAVASEVVGNDLSDVVLVGHSLGGITLPGVARRVPDRLRRLVFVSCVVPPHGRSVGDMLESLSPAVAEVASRLGDDVVDGSGALHPDFATAMFCNDMNDEQQAFALSLLVPESMGVISEPVDLSGLAPAIPITYVRLLRDASLTLQTQDRMAGNARADNIVDIDAGHLVMISSPEKLAAVLNSFTPDVG